LTISAAEESEMDQAAILRIRDRLQAIEDELVEAGLDEFMVACDAGTFTWRTVARSRAEHGEEPPPADAADSATRASRTLHASRHHVCWGMRRPRLMPPRRRHQTPGEHNHTVREN
jgi:hypothetical protein